MMNAKYQKADFSQKAIRKAVMKNTLQHPSVLYPAAIGVLGGVAAVLLGPSLPVLGVCAAGLAIGSGSWLFNFGARSEQFANAYVKRMQETMEAYRNDAFKDLKKELNEIRHKDGLGQFARLSEKFQAFEKMLRSKLSPGELTYVRYLGMAEQVFLSAMDNLQKLASIHKSVAAIKDDYINRRIKELGGKSAPGSAEAEELQSLQQRLDLKNSQLEKMRQLLAKNEQAMTQLDMTLAAIAEIKTVEGHANMDLETAMAELQRLAKRAGDYSIQS